MLQEADSRIHSDRYHIMLQETDDRIHFDSIHSYKRQIIECTLTVYTVTIGRQ